MDLQINTQSAGDAVGRTLSGWNDEQVEWFGDAELPAGTLLYTTPPAAAGEAVAYDIRFTDEGGMRSMLSYGKNAHELPMCRGRQYTVHALYALTQEQPKGDAP